MTESNAVINFLATGTVLLPEDSLQYAKVQQKQFFERYSQEPFIAVARFIAKFLGLLEERRADYESKEEGGHNALRVMEQQLQQTPYLTGTQLSTADIALYAYTHVAVEGGFNLTGYWAVEAWLERIRSEPRYVAMQWSTYLA